MANAIQIKRSIVAVKVPVAGDLAVGELAVNLTDKKIFSKDASNTIIELAAGGGGGASFEVGEVMLATSTPTTGTWLETGKYYSKTAYPALAAEIGDVVDFGTPVAVSQAQLPQNFSTYAKYPTATNGTVTVAVGINGYIQKTTDGSNWVGVPSAIAASFSSVYYLNGNFVAVGAQGTVVTSTDGVAWTARVTPSTSTLNTAAYGNGVYVIPAGNKAVYSTDLVTWTLSTSTTGGNYIVFGNGVFVTSSGFSSSDGNTWVSGGLSGLFYDIIYANGLFVIVGQTGVTYTSPDGVTWTARSTGSDRLNKVIYDNGLFVVVGDNGACYTSPDGITWTARTTLTNSYVSLQSVVWNGSAYVAVGLFGVYFTSPDGVTWTQAKDVSFSDFYGVSVINGKTIAFGTTSSVILAGATRSEILQNGFWNYTVSASSATNPRVIAYNGSSQYVAVGTSGVILTSPDGLEWTGQSSSAFANFDKVQYVNGNYIVMGGNGSNANLLTSNNGITWSSQTAGTSIKNAAAFGAGVYVVVGATNTIMIDNIFSSSDLATWTSRSAGSLTFNDVIYANSLFVAVGGAGACYSSTDGITWTSRSAGSTTFQRIIYENGLFVAVGSSGTIRTSTDGITWTARTSNVSGQLNDVIWNGSLFCAVGASGVITTSSDGVTWTARTPGDTATTLMNISWNGTRFVATNVTNAGCVWVSTDGITWSRVSTVCPTNVTQTVYSAYLGGKFLAIGAGFIQTSTDGINWTNANQVQYVPGAIAKLYKLGGFYYALTTAGLFQSTDGIAFSAVRSIRQGAVLSMAYSGSEWLLVSSAVNRQPQVFYKSTNGTTWTKSADFGTLTSTGTIAGTAIDVVYANGNFISGQTITSAQNIFFAIYTSPDGVTWTGRQTPYLAVPQTVMASNGETVVFGTSNAGVFKSTDGGVSWTQLTSTVSTPVIYSNGAWVFNSISNHTVSPDLSNFYSTLITASAQVPSSIYVSGNKIAAISTQNKIYFNNSSSGYVALPSIGNANVTYIVTNKEIPVRGTTALIAIAKTADKLPNLILETPLYSYDTATTFWIPPSNAGVGQQAYIYAGA